MVIATVGIVEGATLLIGAVIFGAACAAVAARRGRRMPLWAILGVLLGPIALIVVCILPPSRQFTA